MENKKTSPAKYSLTYGLVSGFFGVILSLMLFSLDMHYQGGWQILTIFILYFTFFIMYAIHEYKKENNGFLTLSEGLKIGLGLALVSGIISGCFGIILQEIIDPETINKTLEFQKQTWLESDPEVSYESVNSIIEMQRPYTTPFWTLTSAIVLNLILGFLISLIGSLIVKKSQPE